MQGYRVDALQPVTMESPFSFARSMAKVARGIASDRRKHDHRQPFCLLYGGQRRRVVGHCNDRL